MESKIKLVPVGLLSAFTLKLLILGTTPYEMGTVFALSSVVCAYEYLAKARKIQDIEKLLKDKIDEHTSVINEQNKVIKAMAEELDKVRTNVAGVKMAAGMQNTVKKFGT